MRILWFTNTPSCYKSEKGGYNGGGWISSLEKEIKKIKDIELGICFHLNGEPSKIIQDKVTYYPISRYTNILGKLYNRIILSNKKQDEKDLKQYLKVINDFKPDIINIFGSENNYGLISLHVQIPIILHIQGIITPYLTAFCPPKYSFSNIIFSSFNPIKILKSYRNIKNWYYQKEREQLMLAHIPYFMGRTEWDKRVTEIYAPNSKYFHCNEILRENFYHNQRYLGNNKLNITTTISSPYYKGFDTILQAAYILRYNLKLDFTWNVYGISDVKNHERKFNIKCQECNIKIGGIIDEKTLVSQILKSTVFVHPSYIDNSPNSVCEAQILGCPIIATNVGGIPSLIENGVSGLLIPANDPYQMAYLIQKLHIEKDFAKQIGENGKNIALQRHNKETIIKELISIYNTIK